VDGKTGGEKARVCWRGEILPPVVETAGGGARLFRPKKKKKGTHGKRFAGRLRGKEWDGIREEGGREGRGDRLWEATEGSLCYAGSGLKKGKDAEELFSQGGRGRFYSVTQE